jgi:hypothetical protein
VDAVGTFLSNADPAAAGWFLAGLAVYMILTGKLVPRSLYAEQKQSAEAWRAAWQAERDNLTKLVVPNAELQREVLRALPAQTTHDPAANSVPAPTRQGDPA